MDPAKNAKMAAAADEGCRRHRWSGGPADPRGAVINVSDRPSLCMAVMDGRAEAAVGSSDHAIYILDISNARFRKALYGGTSVGHTEWVTALAYLPDGRLLSGAMDSKLLLWDNTPSASRRCREPIGGQHAASISAIAPLSSSAAVTASYDRTLAVWDLSSSSKARLSGYLRGHSGAVLSLYPASPPSSCHLLASGCRAGSVLFWDAAAGKLLSRQPRAHSGHVTAISSCCCPDVFLSGGQDGVLRAWDIRTNGPLHSQILHSSAKGQGALSCISISQNGQGYPLIVTAGADKLMKVLEPRASFKVLHTLNGHRDFIYSLMASDSLAWSGGGDGSILVHDLLSGKCLYGLGASSNGSAIRCIGLANAKGNEYLVCTGDDGNVMIYKSP